MPGKSKNMMKPYSTDKTEKLLKRLNTSAAVGRSVQRGISAEESMPMVGPAGGVHTMVKGIFGKKRKK